MKLVIIGGGISGLSLAYFLLEQKGLILYSSDRKSFLSLATENKKKTQSQQDR